MTNEQQQMIKAAIAARQKGWSRKDVMALIHSVYDVAWRLESCPDEHETATEVRSWNAKQSRRNADAHGHWHLTGWPWAQV